MKIVGGLLLSVFCVGSVFSSEMEREASVLERTSDDILQKMTSEEYVSRIKVLEDAYDNIVFERDYYKNAADQLLEALKERDAQLEERDADMDELVARIGQI